MLLEDTPLECTLQRVAIPNTVEDGHDGTLVLYASGHKDDFMAADMPTAPETANNLEARLLDVLRGYGRVAVAFSGGVDSAVVAWAAQSACESAVAVTAVSASLASGELEIAQQIAAKIGIPHELIRTSEFSRPGYVANAGDRCYHCKTDLYESIESLIDRSRFDVVANGANLDDLGDHRPGMIAAKEHQVRSPLIEAGLRKHDVREIARRHDLPIWNKPAAPCLSSRVAYGVEVTPERVRQIDAAERFLKEELQLNQLRVRLEANDLARIEVPESHIVRVVEFGRCERVARRLRELGFRSVTLDLEGFRSGNFNQRLPMAELTTSTTPD